MNSARAAVLVLAAAVASATRAYDAAPHARRVIYESPLKLLTRTLGLSAAQQSRIASIWEDSLARSARIVNDKLTEDEERADELFEVTKVRHESIRDVLSESQKVVYDTLFAKPYERVTKTRI